MRILFPSYHNKNITNETLKEKGILKVGFEWRNGWNEVMNILLNENPKTYCKK